MPTPSSRLDATAFRRIPLRLGSRARGAALVEAAVVVPVFILLFVGMIFLHHLVRAKQKIMADARAAAWSHAMNGCGGQGGAWQPDAVLGGGDLWGRNGGGMSDERAGNQVRVTAGGASAGAPVGVSTETSPLGFDQAVSSRVVVMCDQKTASGDVVGIVKWMWGNSGEQMVSFMQALASSNGPP